MHQKYTLILSSNPCLSLSRFCLKFSNTFSVNF
jgi:hypothetical protein